MDDSGYLNENINKKTTTMTFRIDDNVLKTLRAESERHQIFLNTFVIELFNKMSKEEISKMALCIGKNAVYDIALFMKNRMDLESFLSWFETRMDSSLTEINHSIQNGFHVYILKHELGENWSLYHKIILELMFNEIFEKTVDITTSSTTIRFKFHK